MKDCLIILTLLGIDITWKSILAFYGITFLITAGALALVIGFMIKSSK